MRNSDGLEDIATSSESLLKLGNTSNRIMQCLQDADPLQTVMGEYDRAEDKDLFVAALAYSLLVRHRQWQAAASRGYSHVQH